ncbi:hypothetical protein BASA81_012036 [Batrachochytrium salamandrivorans]|nr:hypothetical protein BASA81_012036 [Batrachochytrium salamandrivorans]
MQGARIRTSAVRDIRWISRQGCAATSRRRLCVCFHTDNYQSGRDYRQVLSKPGFLAPKQQTRTSSLLFRRLLQRRSLPSSAVLMSKPGTSLDLCSHLLVARPSRQPLLEAAKIRVQTPGFDISTLETVPKESLPVKKATDKEPAAPAVDPPSDTAAEVTPAIQDDGVTPTVTPIADVEMCL